jgi:hypothetical protein
MIPVNPQELAMRRFLGNRIRRKIRVANDEIIAMPHGAQRIENIGIEKRIK